MEAETCVFARREWSEGSLAADVLLDRVSHCVHLVEASKPGCRCHESKRRLKQPCS